MKVVESESMEFRPLDFAIRAGAPECKYLVVDELSPGKRFQLMLMRYGFHGDPFYTPRHRHTFEQVRYTVEGSHNYAPKKDLDANHVAYFPAGAYYGPQNSGPGHVLYFQWGPGYMTDDQFAHAYRELSKTGTFEKGVYSTVDPETGKKKNKDGSAACYEFIYNQPLEFPEPRYPVPIEMNPEAFEWRSVDVHVSLKPLAKVTEREISISFMRWDSSGPQRFDPGQVDIVFSSTPGLVVDGASRPARTAIWSPAGEALELDGAEGTEALLISVPV